MLTRQARFQQLFPNLPSFRWKQIQTGIFQTSNQAWEDITTLSKEIRSRLQEATLPWISISEVQRHSSLKSPTVKVVLVGEDGLQFESVLMGNKRGQWTICLSSQVGCGMQCVFCATGKMGFKRQLTSDEIVDQYRFWQRYLISHPPPVTSVAPITVTVTDSQSPIEKEPTKPLHRISNIVFMGMGEPLHNYENVKKALREILDYTDLGPTKITVSTVGLMEKLDYLLTDPEWPNVRIAISLHSPNPDHRKKIVPTSIENFHSRLAKWSQNYQTKLGNRNRYLTFEYTLISQINDHPENAEELVNYVKKTAIRKINIIPLNPSPGNNFARSHQDRINQFKLILQQSNLDVTQRRTMGDDIAAACGQLAITNKNKNDKPNRT